MTDTQTRLSPDPTAERIRNLATAQETARTAALSAKEASKQARGSRALLASDIRDVALELYGSVSVFCDVVHERKGTPSKSVWNALYSTFGADTLARCVETLAEVQLEASAEGHSQKAA